MKNAVVGYYAIINSDKAGGVNKKINQFIESVNEFTNAKCFIRSVKPGVFSSLNLAVNIANANEDIIYIRGNSYGLFVTFFGMLLCRIRGKKVILEIATPQVAVIKEVVNSSSLFPIKFIKLLGLFFSGPWSFTPAHKIVQYGVEGWWFSCFSNKKIILIGNGCSVNRIPKIESSPTWPSDYINIIMVANFSKTHGVDLLIRALAILNKRNQKKYYLSLVGDGLVIEQLQILVEELGQVEYVNFHGSLHGAELLEQYKVAHIAAGALALHRVGVNTASALKLREYCATGVPFFYTGIDPDFPLQLDFAYSLPSCESPEEIVKILDYFSSRKSFPSSKIMRDYAIEYLDFRVKIPRILGEYLSSH